MGTGLPKKKQWILETWSEGALVYPEAEKEKHDLLSMDCFCVPYKVERDDGSPMFVHNRIQ
jgi:hypothetical protein